jgi:hypothetical protein
MMVFTLIVLSPLQAIAFLLVHQALFGVYLGMTFAPNHKGMPHPTGDEDYLRKQVLTSRNVRGGRLTDAALGGLNYQIEHHLFPGMPTPNLREAQPIVQAYCAEIGVAYEQTNLITSYRQALQYLHEVGAPPRPILGRNAPALSAPPQGTRTPSPRPALAPASPAGQRLRAALIRLPLKSIEVALRYTRLLQAQSPTTEAGDPLLQLRHRNAPIAVEVCEDPTNGGCRDVLVRLFHVVQPGLQLIEMGALLRIRCLPLAIANDRCRAGRRERGHGYAGQHPGGHLRQSRPYLGGAQPRQLQPPTAAGANEAARSAVAGGTCS